MTTKAPTRPTVERMMRFPEGLYQEIVRLAQENGWAINTEIVQALRRHVKESKESKDE